MRKELWILDDKFEAWILDAHSNNSSDGMVLWIHDGNKVIPIEYKWKPCIHVSGDKSRLFRLEEWLAQPEIKSKFSISETYWERAKLSLYSDDIAEVLCIEIKMNNNLLALAKHIEERGQFIHFQIYSVDAHLSQRFLLELNTAPMRKVLCTQENGRINVDSKSDYHTSNDLDLPDLSVWEFELCFVKNQDFLNYRTPIFSFILRKKSQDGRQDSSQPEHYFELVKNQYSDDREFLYAIESLVKKIDPDVMISHGGDALFLPALIRLARKSGTTVSLGRNNTVLYAKSKERVVFSYGRTLRKNAYHPLQGRLHIDISSSFIVREGGLVGLFELARHSGQSAQDISRLSPGSVISAIQMRTAIEDGILVPWKKNRPEDTKTAWDLLHADRGGLYLDSKPGVYANVIELDFASLFPSIIATRNISPETLNCACCISKKKVFEKEDFASDRGFIPLQIDEARSEFRKRNARRGLSANLFPQTSEVALQIPGLTTHSCANQHGFLGRVVAPLIERRQLLKDQRKKKGDVFDQQQNALKWLLVTCFGYTGYKNARFGRIEAHEAICAWARDILLETIDMAQEMGYDVLHAIVDCVWIIDRLGRSDEQRISDAHKLAERVTSIIGIPLEYEDDYSVIAFLPSRVTNAGTLTKYWAHGDKGFKIRGIEERQHSTCKWIAKVQRRALKEIMDEHKRGEIPELERQYKAIKLLKSEITKLELGQIDLNDLVVKRRISKPLNQFKVASLAYCAMLRNHMNGNTCNPGSKVKFVVVNDGAKVDHERVILDEEIGFEQNKHKRGDFNYYRTLAIRAIWSVLAPFGWDEEEISQYSKRKSLVEFTYS